MQLHVGCQKVHTRRYCRFSGLYIFHFREPGPIYSLLGKIYLLHFGACGKAVRILIPHSRQSCAEKCLEIVRDRLVFSHRGGDRLLREWALVAQINQG